jgi:hypothetical protein
MVDYTWKKIQVEIEISSVSSFFLTNNCVEESWGKFHQNSGDFNTER